MTTVYVLVYLAFGVVFAYLFLELGALVVDDEFLGRMKRNATPLIVIIALFWPAIMAAAIGVMIANILKD